MEHLATEHPATLTARVDPLGDGFIERVDQLLAAYLAGERERWQAKYPVLAAPLEELATFTLSGGKRLRSQFAFWSFVGNGGETTDESIVRLGAAIELLHTFALVHDDIMDDSDTRRRRPSMHQFFARQYDELGWAGERRRTSESFAMLLGDLCFAYSVALVSGMPAPVLDVFDEMRIELHMGQFLDLVGAAEQRHDLSTDIATYKTAKYTVERPVHLGATLASTKQGGNATTRVETAALSRFGLALGEAFQLRDDMLGVLGSAEITGKPVGDDIRCGKMTLLMTEALSSPDGPDALRRFGTAQLTETDVTAIAEFIERGGAAARVEARIIDLVKVAIDALDDAELTLDGRDGLARLAEQAVWRSR